MTRATGTLVLSLDVGTTGARAFLLDETGAVAGQAYRETLPACPAPGYVEHDLEQVFAAVAAVVRSVMHGVTPGRVRGLGLTTQRATAVVWDAASGRPLGPGLSWQDTRTHERCQGLMAQGLMITPLMAASKIEWLLDRTDADRSGVRAGRIRCGTLDAWLAARLTGGRVQATDASNASCTGLYDLFGGGWNASTLETLRIPEPALPSIVDSGGVLGSLGDEMGLGSAPLASIVGDQQAATMGHLRLEPGEVKITYGTAAMLDMNAGPEPLFSMHGAYPLVLWQRDGCRTYCLEGTAITAGAAVLWLRDLGVIADVADSAALAASVPDSGGVWAVPAFQGLGTPYLDASARAVVGGLSRASTRAHVVRAVLEGVAWRCREVYDALRADSSHPPPVSLRADGGAARNDVLLQAQADALGLPVERPEVLDAAALGAAYLAGLATGVWTGTDDLRHAWRRQRVFEPVLGDDERAARLARWKRYVTAARSLEGAPWEGAA
ncbi:MAG TPA: FGGY family carbohydrate kinase [Candidatus Binatia bacterium]|nr:FGGY family carbohydrate kinase [Candidatus Binatia bacterium]